MFVENLELNNKNSIIFEGHGRDAEFVVSSTLDFLKRFKEARICPLILAQCKTVVFPILRISMR